MDKLIDSLDGGRVTFRPRHLALHRVTLDPVCGSELEADQAATSVSHSGQAYFFCSPACKARFLEDPESYL